MHSHDLGNRVHPKDPPQQGGLFEGCHECRAKKNRPASSDQAGLKKRRLGAMQTLRQFAFGTIAASLFMASSVMAFGDDPPSRVARLKYISGEVSMQPGGVNDWATATINRPKIGRASCRESVESDG